MPINLPEFEIPEGFDLTDKAALVALIDGYRAEAESRIAAAESLGADLQIALEEKTTKYDALYSYAGENNRLGLVWPWAPDRSREAEQLRRGEVPVLLNVPEASTLTRFGAADNILIEGDNLPGTMAYLASGAPKADIIYIDPVYNTGGDLAYGDTFIEKDDPKYHSSWLSMMLPRLVLAKCALREDGVIAVSIGNDEHGHLRVLMDRVFGFSNFMSHVTWAGSIKNDARDFSNTSDYTFFYYKDKPTRIRREVENKTERPGKRAMLDTAAELFAAATERYGEGEQARLAAEDAFKKWFKESPDAQVAAGFPGNHQYLNIDEHGNVFRPDNISWPGGGGPKYVVKNPFTDEVVSTPKPGWRYGEERFWELHHDKKRIIFNGKNVPQYKRLLTDVEEVSLRDIVFKDRGNAGRKLTAQLGLGSDGKAVFDYPKDQEILALWFDYVVPQFRKDESATKPIVVLDFFAGSGSTGLAVLDLDAPKPDKPKEEWRFVLVTNDEPVRKNSALTIARDVTARRLRAYVTGEWSDGKVHATFDANVHFYQAKLMPLTDRQDYADLSVDDAYAENFSEDGDVAAERMQHQFAGSAGVGKNAHWRVRNTVALQAEADAIRALGNRHAVAAFNEENVEVLRGPGVAVALWQNYGLAVRSFNDGSDDDPSGIMKGILASYGTEKRFAFIPSGDADGKPEFDVANATATAFPVHYLARYRSLLKTVFTAGRFGEQ